MTEEKWLDLLENLKQKFEINREQEEQISKDDVGNEIISNIDRVLFENELGEFKLEKVTRPVILDKKVHYSHNAGNKSLVEYILSPDEKTTKVHLFKKDGSQWSELNISEGNITF